MGNSSWLILSFCCVVLLVVGGCGESSGEAGVARPDPAKFALLPERALHRQSGILLVRIPAGTFTMGSPSDEPRRQEHEWRREVEITDPFYLGETEVTVGQWRRVMGRETPRKQQQEDMPVEGVTWYAAKEFVAALNALDGGGWRLPTEIEWEYACRAGTTTIFSFGDTLNLGLASYDGRRPFGDTPRQKTPDHPLPVRSHPANPWGLYDMHGNMWVWCEDLYVFNPARDLPPLQAQGASRVIRGGGYPSRGDQLRSAYRDGYPPRSTGEKYGFRVAWSPK